MGSAVPRRKLLLVEDDNVVRISLKELLLSSGYSVQAVKNAHEALGIVSSFRPHVFVCNVHLSTTSGVDLADQILKLLPRCTIILTLSGASDVRTRTHELLSYPFPVVEGPLQSGALISKLEKAWSLGEKRIRVAL